MQDPYGHEGMIKFERCCASYACAQYGVARGLLMRDDAMSSSIDFRILLLQLPRNVVKYSVISVTERLGRKS